jgi:hypothetical protein
LLGFPGTLRLNATVPAIVMSENQNPPQPDPALRRLDRLVGAWTMEGNLVGSDDKNIKGETAFRWLVGASYSVASCDLHVLMDQPAKSISPHDRPSRHDNLWLAWSERQLPQGAVRTMLVVVVGVLGQDRPQLPAAADEHPVQHLASHGADPSLRVGIRPRRPHRRAQYLDPLSSKDRIARDGELGITIAQHKLEPTDALLKVHQQVPGLLCRPLPHRRRRHPEHMNSAGRHLDHKQHVQPLQQHGVHGEEVHR